MPFSLKSFLQSALSGSSSETPSPSPEAPDSPAARTGQTPLIQRLHEFHDAQRIYLEDNNIPHQLADGEEPIAVITTRSDSTPDDLSKLGIALEEWLAFTKSPTRILGLGHLRSGRHPEVPPSLLNLQTVLGPAGYTVKRTSLIASRDTHNIEFILDDIESIVSRSKIARVLTFSTYRQLMR